MTIRRGEPWGEPGALAPDGRVVHTDEEARAVVLDAVANGRPVPELGLLGGDLHRTLGARRTDAAGLRSGAGVRFPVDLGWVALDDGPETPFVAHVVVRGRVWFRGPTWVALNASFVGDWNLAPAGHPNDGVLRVLDGALSARDRRLARPRFPLGTHVPHPSLRERRTREAGFDASRPIGVWIDGAFTGRATRVRVRVEPDALLVVA